MQKWFINNQNIVMNIVAILSFLYEPVIAYFSSQPFNWKTFGTMIVVALLSYFKGKYPLGLVNNSKLSIQQERDIKEQGFATSSDLKPGG